MKEERYDTNLLRVIAIALVVNSHLDSLLPAKFAFFATGGMMGNALFFMLSGWGLLVSHLGRRRSFTDWYGRRILRIYPSVWVTVLLLTVPVGIYSGAVTRENVLEQMGKFFFPPFWFLQALMVYYAILFWILRAFNVRRLAIAATAIVIGYSLYYVFLLDKSTFSIEQTPFRLIFYLLVALFGLYLGTKAEQIKYAGVRDYIGLVASVTCIYLHKYLMQRGMLASYQVVQHIATFPTLYFLAKVARSPLAAFSMHSRYVGPLLTFLSGITLEIFIVNNSIDFIDGSLGGFPLNVCLLLTVNVALALLVYYLAKALRNALGTSRDAQPNVQETAEKFIAAC
jgi:peptidoglycan/LPS O-acetylase OafA/YrhL